MTVIALVQGKKTYLSIICKLGTFEYFLKIITLFNCKFFKDNFIKSSYSDEFLVTRKILGLQI